MGQCDAFGDRAGLTLLVRLGWLGWPQHHQHRGRGRGAALLTWAQSPGQVCGARYARGSCVHLPKSSFCSHPSLPALPFQGVSSMLFAGCRHPPNSKAELRVPQNGMQPPRAPRSISASEEGLWQQELPLAISEQGTQCFAPGGELTTEILYLSPRGESTALVVRTRTP